MRRKCSQLRLIEMYFYIIGEVCHTLNTGQSTITIFAMPAFWAVHTVASSVTRSSFGTLIAARSRKAFFTWFATFSVAALFSLIAYLGIPPNRNFINPSDFTHSFNYKISNMKNQILPFGPCSPL